MKNKQVNYKDMRDRLVAHELNKLRGQHGNHLRTLLYKGHTGWNNMPKRIVKEQYDSIFGNDKVEKPVIIKG